MESTEGHDRQGARRTPRVGHSAFVMARRPIPPPALDLWSTLADALAAGRPAFAWLHGDEHMLALDDARRPGGWRYQAWRFDAAAPRAPWQAWPRRISRAPAAVATWTPRGCTAFAQGPFSGWPQGLTAAPEAHQPTSAGRSLEARSAWMARVADAEAACRGGQLHKVVLARATRHAGTMCAAATLQALHARHPEAIVFCVTQGDEAFVGATPETLVRIDGDQIDTHALAGTRPRGRTAAEDRRLADVLQRSVKERREHAAVVEDVADTLAPLCAALDWSSSPRVKPLATVQHLETPFHGRLRPGVRALRVAQALHPTAALGGLPRPAAQAWLAQHEALDRGFYGAPIGWIDGKQAHLAVAIRSALITPAAAYTFAGAGVVAGADPDAEWRETDAKQASVAAALRSRGAA